MADSLLGYTLAQQGVNLNSSSSAPSQVNPRTTTSTVLRYPIKNITSQDDYLKIRVVKYQPGGLGLSGQGISLRTTEDALRASGSLVSTPIATIILPMPRGIEDNNAADWTRGEMNPLQAFATGTVAQSVLSNNIVGPIISNAQNITKGAANIIGTSEGQRAVAGGAAALVQKAVLGNSDLNALISRASGQIFNQNAEMLFNGVQIRPAFSFNFDMVPRSQSESIMIKNIIRTFKQNMAPRSGSITDAGGGLFIGAPQIFILEYMSGGKPHPFLHRFKPCALTQMSVNYNASAQYATYADATPVHMRMLLQFQELTPIYQGDYNTESGRQGVGY